MIVAKDCVLEILPKIDFPGLNDAEQAAGRFRKQLVHMLAVALDMDIAHGAVTDLGWQRENLPEILIGLFVRTLADVVRQGLPPKLRGHEEDLSALRGRLDVTRQFTILAVDPQKLACRYDALSLDIVLKKTYGPPVCKRILRRSEQSASTYTVS